MKQKKSGKLEATVSIIDNLKTIILTIIGLAILIGVIVAIIKVQTTPSSDPGISTTEAQTKCILMEEADLVNLSGEPLNDATRKKAENLCLSQWDTADKEASFKEIIKSDWETRKTEVLNGYTLEQIYNESI